MPSTIVHLAFAGMIGAALLGSAFDRRALAVIFGVVVFADLDAFVALLWAPAHRAAFHTLLIPAIAGVLVAVDLRREDESYLRRRWGGRGVRVAWVTVVVYAAAAIGLDLFSAGGANAFWPIHDQFYEVGGKIELSSTRGLIQTVVDLGAAPTVAPSHVGARRRYTSAPASIRSGARNPQTSSASSPSSGLGGNSSCSSSEPV